MPITDSILKAAMPGLAPKKRTLYLPYLNEAMREFDITSSNFRCAAFLAQVAHESCDLLYMEEIWGPTPAQLRYEGREDLGNTVRGDGYRYRGRGPLQLTGRANYRRYGRLLKVDLETNPDWASLAHQGFRIAGLYWKLHGLNDLADKGAFTEITRRINGGLNGLADRQIRYHRALKALS